ncbi:MAG: coproporphyrinogen dehydrogenase HemZ [Oscillospiraceae bacterium]|jgi:oxygen-independent coproporphyrinogen-3 oxidase|nr:coproporphyrinogen dehydrogenase HemZ [Oscillospiraceae bacterium]
MMQLYVIGHKFHYELESLCRVFYPGEQIFCCVAATSAEKLLNRRLPRQVRRAGFAVITRASPAGDGVRFSVTLAKGRLRLRLGRVVLAADADAQELAMAQLLFVLLLRACGGAAPPWGLLTGVRPSKLMLRLRRDTGAEAAERRFRASLWVSPAKTALAAQVARAEEPVLALTRPDSFSLYIAIPFCPSRCSYCSFVSHTVDRQSAQKRIPAYLEKLCAELESTAAIARQLGLRLASVYIGGGTPTILEPAQLEQLCGTVAAHFDAPLEFTAEAGRPDTITAQKLAALRRGGVDRVSVNPQSMEAEVLRLAGRPHSAAQCVEAYALARAAGFGSINMDLIAGLPGDSPAGFRRTLEQVIALAPENITVHTLAIKRAAELRRLAGDTHNEGAAVTADMLALAAALLPAAGYEPYYMYRQSHSLGNLENLGWSRPGRFCRYNIDMMEESHTVLACGAGAVTKLKQPGGDWLERVFSFKYPYEYLSRFAEVLARKERIVSFYASYNIGGDSQSKS